MDPPGGDEDHDRHITDSFIGKDPAPPKQEYKGCCAPCKWFMAAPMKRYQFLIFFVFGLATIIWLSMYAITIGGAQSYILAGVACIVSSIYALFHFRTLLNLKDQVDKMNVLNVTFRKENKALKKEIDKLNFAERKLSSVQHELGKTNEKLEENIEKFRKLDSNLSKLGKSNIKVLESLQKKSKQIIQTIHDDLIRNEKVILNKVFDYLEFADKQEGFTEDEFNEFWKRMPDSYYQRFKQSGLTFEKIAGKDGIIDQQEFTDMVDRLAEDEGMAGGSIGDVDLGKRK